MVNYATSGRFFQCNQKFIENNNGFFPENVEEIVSDLSRKGATPLVVAENNQVLGVIHLKDIVKGGIKQRFAQLRKMGIRTIMITGDNPQTAAAIAAEAGVDDFWLRQNQKISFTE